MKFSMNLGPRSYDIIIKRGVLARVNRLTQLNGRVCIVCDDGVPKKLVKTLMAQCGQPLLVVLPQGEENKTATAWQAILSRMLEAGFDRGDMVAALGGGVVGDVAGFAAASYMRGIAWCQFPTTTMAQLDSSIGGKVGINLDGVKNVVGAFHQPSLVAIDPDALKTLPKRHWANGLAEALKTALVGSRELFELMEHEDIDKNMERLLYLSLRYKSDLVARDEREQGERQLLNFGHTIGHGIEAAGGFSGLLHGEAVALGMLPMIESRTLLRRTRAVMKKLALPLKMPYSAQEVFRYVQRDKKRKAGSYTLVRVKQLGHGYLETVDEDELRLLLEESY